MTPENMENLGRAARQASEASAKIAHALRVVADVIESLVTQEVRKLPERGN